MKKPVPPIPPNLPFHELNRRVEPVMGYAYKLFDTTPQGQQQPGQAALASYGLDVVLNGPLRADPNRMSLWIPFVDGNIRDGVGDLLEVGGIDTSRHRLNPIVLFDHGKHIQLPIAQASDPEAENSYTVQLDPIRQCGELEAFFYQGKGNLPSLSKEENYNHALFCEQLYDLAIKKFLRGGSIGYQVIQAKEIPPNYEKGTPKGLHLIRTKMLEGSLVVLPANMVTVRKALSPDGWNPVEAAREILAMPNVCGKSLSPYLVKSLTPLTKASPRFVETAPERYPLSFDPAPYTTEKIGSGYYAVQGGHSVGGETRGGSPVSDRPHKTREGARDSAIRHGLRDSLEDESKRRRQGKDMTPPPARPQPKTELKKPPLRADAEAAIQQRAQRKAMKKARKTRRGGHGARSIPHEHHDVAEGKSLTVEKKNVGEEYPSKESRAKVAVATEARSKNRAQKTGIASSRSPGHTQEESSALTQAQRRPHTKSAPQKDPFAARKRGHVLATSGEQIPVHDDEELDYGKDNKVSIRKAGGGHTVWGPEHVQDWSLKNMTEHEAKNLPDYDYDPYVEKGEDGKYYVYDRYDNVINGPYDTKPKADAACQLAGRAGVGAKGEKSADQAGIDAATKQFADNAKNLSALIGTKMAPLAAAAASAVGSAVGNMVGDKAHETPRPLAQTQTNKPPKGYGVPPRRNEQEKAMPKKRNTQEQAEISLDLNTPESAHTPKPIKDPKLEKQRQAEITHQLNTPEAKALRGGHRYVAVGGTDEELSEHKDTGAGFEEANAAVRASKDPKARIERRPVLPDRLKQGNTGQKMAVHEQHHPKVPARKFETMPEALAPRGSSRKTTRLMPGPKRRQEVREAEHALGYKGKALPPEEEFAEEEPMGDEGPINELPPEEPMDPMGGMVESAPSEKPGATLLRGLHDNLTILLAEYDAQLETQENPKLLAFMQQFMESLETTLTMLEELFAAEYPDAEDLAGAAMGEEAMMGDEMGEVGDAGFDEEPGVGDEMLEEEPMGGDINQQEATGNADMDTMEDEGIGADSEMLPEPTPDEVLEGMEKDMLARGKSLRGKYKAMPECAKCGQKDCKGHSKAMKPARSSNGSAGFHKDLTDSAGTEDMPATEVGEEMKSYSKAFSKDHKKHIREGADWLGEVGRTSSELWNDESRMKSYHYHKTLEGILGLEEAEELLEKNNTEEGQIPPADFDPGVGAKAAPNTDTTRRAAVRPASSSFGQTVPGGGSQAGGSAASPWSPLKQSEGPGREGRFVGEAKPIPSVGSHGRPQSGWRQALHPDFKGLHPHRKSCAEASGWLEELSRTRGEFGDRHRKRSEELFKSLDEIANSPDEEEMDEVANGEVDQPEEEFVEEFEEAGETEDSTPGEEAEQVQEEEDEEKTGEVGEVGEKAANEYRGTQGTTPSGRVWSSRPGGKPRKTQMAGGASQPPNTEHQLRSVSKEPLRFGKSLEDDALDEARKQFEANFQKLQGLMKTVHAHEVK